MLGLKFFIEIKGSSFSVVTHVSSTLNGTCPHKREAWLKGEKAPLLLQYCTIFLAVPFFWILYSERYFSTEKVATPKNKVRHKK